MLIFFIIAVLAVDSWSHPIKASFNQRRSVWFWNWGSDIAVSIVDRNPPLTFASSPASFGPELSSPVVGYVIPVSAFTRPCPETFNPNSTSLVLDGGINNEGCPKLCLDGHHVPDQTWIALVQRGGCPFVQKVREAQHLGAHAVVVGGNDPYMDTLVGMYSEEDSSDINITSSYIRYSDYMTLSSLISTSETWHSGFQTLSLLLSADYSAWEWYSPIITFFLILLLPSSLAFLTLMIHRIRAHRDAIRDRAPEDVVNSLPTRVWAPPEKPENEGTTAVPTHRMWWDEQMECAICLSPFALGETLRILPCHHIFHVAEVDEWLLHRKKVCPICKADVTSGAGSTSSTPPAPTPSSALSPTSDNSPRTEPTEQTPLLSSVSTT